MSDAPDSVKLKVVESAADGTEKNREIIFKVAGEGAGLESNAVVSTQETENGFLALGAIDPPYPPDSLCRIFEHSNSLRQCVDAYVTNIESFGFRLDPLIDFESSEADEQIADAIWLSRGGGSDRPSDQEVAEKKKEMVAEAVMEKASLLRFFGQVGLDLNLTSLRKRKRGDQEVQGNAYWEILRSKSGEPARFVHVPAQTVRLMPLDPRIVTVREKVRSSVFAYTEKPARKRFRKYVQMINGMPTVYFKQFGDPRTYSKKTGDEIRDPESHQWDSGDGPATEIIHFEIYSPRSAYGVPRWIGALLSVLGSRSAEEVNYYYFENKAVPPLAILVSGGRLAEEAIPRLETFIKENLQGSTKSFHKIMILEAEGEKGGGTAGNVKIEIKPLTEAMIQEELFSKYDERNIDKVGEAFRLPRILRGQSKDFNRATSLSALRFGEEQVFQPERDEFDAWINREIFPLLNSRYWIFRTNAPLTRDPERMTEMVVKLVEVGVLTPNEGRLLAGDIFNRDFREIREDWGRQPLKMTLAGIKGGNGQKGADGMALDVVGGNDLDKMRDGDGRETVMFKVANLQALRDLCDQRLSDIDDHLLAQDLEAFPEMDELEE